MNGRSTVIENIALLLTGDDEPGELTDAWIVIDSEQIAAVGTGSVPTADDRIDVDGRCVLPGFVDSHTHLVYGGDRADEFAARMAGQPYQAGGIRTTVAATRANTEDELLASATARRDEGRRSGITTVEIKSGYGLTVEEEARLLRVGRSLTPDTTFLGAHVVPPEYDGRTDEYVDLVCGDMLAACGPHARWIDAFCERGAFDVDQCRSVLEAGHAAGLGLRLHANQLGHGPGVQLAVELGCAAVDHCTYLSDSDIDALASSPTVATFLPATDFSTRQPYPDARRLIDAGGRVAIATNCNPGSSATTSMPFCIALAVREMRMTVDEAVRAATVGGAAALGRTDVGRVAPGCRADLAVLDAPSAMHLAYRPGVPLVAMTIEAGTTVWRAQAQNRSRV